MLLLEGIRTYIYLDTGCGISLIDRVYLRTQLPDILISKIASPLRVRGIGSNRHLTDKFVFIPVYIPGTRDGTLVLIYFKREFYIMDKLRANILIGNNIIGPKSIDIRIFDKSAYIGSYGVICQIECRQRKQFERRKVYSNKLIIVQLYTQTIVPVKRPHISADKDFIFEPLEQLSLTLYVYIVNATMAGILIKNETNKPVQIPKRIRLGCI